jgi:hypothetical protein
VANFRSADLPAVLAPKAQARTFVVTNARAIGAGGRARTDMRAFRKLELAEAFLVELREWSRMADDLSADKKPSR